MTVEFWVGQEFETTHERIAILTFLNDMRTKFENSSDYYFVLANFYLDGRQVDLAVIKNKAIIVIEMKECSDPFRAAENGDWLTIPDQSIIGEKGKNPFEQVKQYRLSWINYLKRNQQKFLIHEKINHVQFEHTSAVVCVSPKLHPDTQNNIDASVVWFNLTGLDQLSTSVYQRTSKSIDLSEEEIRKLIGLLNLREGDLSLGKSLERRDVTVDLPPCNLERFVGRKKEIDNIQDLLLTNNAIPTIAIVGEPGVGKSTLALAFAYQAAEKFPDGVLWCYAENLDAQGVVQYLVEGFGKSVGKGILSQPWAAWNRYISKKSALIIIDNADNLVVDPFRPVGERCKTILTMRNRVYPDRLGLPPTAIIDLTELNPSESLEMLKQILDRDLADREIPAAYDVINKIGGLPLAIEVAAYFLNQTRNLTLDEYSSRLSQYGLGSLLPHPTIGIHPVFKSSLDIHKPAVQDFFASLGVCVPGTFSEDVALALGCQLVSDPPSALSRLVDFSLLRRAEDKRFTFQPLLREFARETALERNLLHDAEQRYYHWHEELVTDYSVHDDLPDDIIAQNMPILAREIEGILTTAEGKLATSGVDLLAWREFWRKIRRVCVARGYFERVIDLLETALEIIQARNVQLNVQEDQVYVALEAYFAAQLGKFYDLAGQSGEAIKILKRAKKIEKDEERITHINTSLSKAHRKLRNIPEAIQVLQQNLEITGKVSNQNLAYSLNALGRAELVAGNPQKALEHFEQALQIEKTDSLADRSRSITLSEAGRALRKLGRYSEALKYFEEALELSHHMDDPRGISILHNEIGETLGYLERYPEAMEHHLRSLELTCSVMDSRSRIIVHRRMLKTLIPLIKKAKRAKEDKKWNEALPLMIAWEQSDRALGEMKHVFWAMIDRADVLARLMRSDEALSVYEEARSIAKQNNDSHGLSVSSKGRARVLESMSDFQSLQSALSEVEFAESIELEHGLKGDDLSYLQTMKARIKWKIDRKKPKDQKDEYWEHIKQGKKLVELNEIPQALQQFDQALVGAEMIGDLKLRSRAHQSRARLLGRMQDEKDRQEALHEWTKAELLEYQRETLDSKEISHILTSKGSLLLRMGNRHMALRVAEAALTYVPDSPYAQDLINRIATRTDSDKRLIVDKQLIVGCRGVVKKKFSRPNENNYFGFITFDQPSDGQDVFFTPSNIECGWDDFCEGDSVVVDWYKKPDGRLNANRVIPTDKF